MSLIQQRRLLLNFLHNSFSICTFLLVVMKSVRPTGIFIRFCSKSSTNEFLVKNFVKSEIPEKSTGLFFIMILFFTTFTISWSCRIGFTEKFIDFHLILHIYIGLFFPLFSASSFHTTAVTDITILSCALLGRTEANTYALIVTFEFNTFDEFSQ